MSYIVYYTGEYDLDDNGNIIPSCQMFDNYEDAVADAREWERTTRCIASVVLA